MITTNNDNTMLDGMPLMDAAGQGLLSAKKESYLTPTQNQSIDQSDTQLVLRSKFAIHHPKAGLNPLVDIAGYLFSILGKLKRLKSYRNLNKLHKELAAEISDFQDAAEAKGYRSECTMVSRYALCVTFDDVIANTPWGGQGQWDNYSLRAAFNAETAQQERFFLILERIIKEPALYIDVMEFMYICLSLGYKGSYRATEFSNNQLEKITHGLYKRIRAYHGDFSTALSPFPIKASPSTKITSPKVPYGLLCLATAVVVLLLFVGLGSMLDTISNQAYQALTHIGKSTPYEINKI